MLRTLVFTAVVRSTHRVSIAAQSECLKLGRVLRQLHESRVVYKKRKKLTDQSLLSRVMDKSQQETKEVPVVTLEDGELNSSDDDDVQFVTEVRPPEPVMAKRLHGKGILLFMAPRPE